jgi:gas vesicle protein
MNEYTSHRGNEAMVGFVFGALVGAATALLLAPATGEETRRKLAETTRKLRDQGQDLAEKARNTYEHVRHEAGGARTPGQGIGTPGV